jgi:flagellum-specific peptidoglycan hydrolase FlgJ
MSISSALKSTVSALTGFAGNTTRAILGLSTDPAGKSPKNLNEINQAYSESLSSSTKILGAIFSQMQKARAEELSNRMEQENQTNNKKQQDDKFNEELIKALCIRRKPSKPKKEPTKKEEPKPTEKKVEEKKIEPKPQEKKVEKKEEVKPPPEKVPVKEVPKEAVKPPPKEVPKEVPKPTAEKVAPTPPAAVKPSTLGKIAAGAAVGATGIFATKEAFSGTMMPFAEQASKALGGKVPPVAILGQWFGESGGGKSLPADFNYAGIKAGPKDQKGSYVLTEERYNTTQLERAQKSGETLERVLGPNDKMIKYQNGQKVEKTVDEWFGKGAYDKAQSEGLKWVQVKSYFAKFNNFQDFTDKYISFLKAPRYSKALNATTPSEFGFEVAKAGYATASADKYRDKIASFANSYTPVSSSDSVGTQVNDISNMNKDLKASATNKPQTIVNNTMTPSSEPEADIVVRGNKKDDRSALQRKTQ